MQGKGAGPVNRVELESQVLCAALRQSAHGKDKIGAFTSVRELSHLFPDLLPPPEKDDEASSTNKANYYALLSIKPQTAANGVLSSYLRAVKRFLRKRRPLEERGDYSNILNAGFVLRKPRLRLSHDLVVARRWLHDESRRAQAEQQEITAESIPALEVPIEGFSAASRQVPPVAPAPAKPVPQAPAPSAVAQPQFPVAPPLPVPAPPLAAPEAPAMASRASIENVPSTAPLPSAEPQAIMTSEQAPDVVATPGDGARPTAPPLPAAKLPSQSPANRHEASAEQASLPVQAEPTIELAKPPVEQQKPAEETIEIARPPVEMPEPASAALEAEAPASRLPEAKAEATAKDEEETAAPAPAKPKHEEKLPAEVAATPAAAAAAGKPAPAPASTSDADFPPAAVRAQNQAPAPAGAAGERKPGRISKQAAFVFDESQLRKTPDRSDKPLPMVVQMLEAAQVIGQVEVQALRAQLELAPNIPVERHIVNNGYLTPSELASAKLGENLIQNGKITMAQFQVAFYDERYSGLRMADSLQVRGWLSVEVRNAIDEWQKKR